MAKLRVGEISRRMASGRPSQQAFFGASALLFAASAAVTIVWCASMSAMGEMPMPPGSDNTSQPSLALRASFG
jgi:hypothetical protein